MFIFYIQQALWPSADDNFSAGSLRCPHPASVQHNGRHKRDRWWPTTAWRARPISLNFQCPQNYVQLFSARCSVPVGKPVDYPSKTDVIFKAVVENVQDVFSSAVSEPCAYPAQGRLHCNYRKVHQGRSVQASSLGLCTCTSKMLQFGSPWCYRHRVTQLLSAKNLQLKGSKWIEPPQLWSLAMHHLKMQLCSLGRNPLKTIHLRIHSYVKMLRHTSAYSKTVNIWNYERCTKTIGKNDEPTTLRSCTTISNGRQKANANCSSPSGGVLTFFLVVKIDCCLGTSWTHRFPNKLAPTPP